MAPPPAPAFREGLLLAALMFGNFVIGTGVLLPAGMLSELASGLNITVPQAGSLMIVSGVVVAAGAPLAAALTSQVDRRLLLTATLILYVVCHGVSAFAASLLTLQMARVGIAISAAVFTPQAASAVGALLPPHRRARAITLIFIGWSLATVAGIPASGLIASWTGWHSAFAAVAALSAVAAAAIWMTVPSGIRIPPLSSASWRQLFTSPALMTVLLVTGLNGTGHFTAFIYLNPSLKESLGASLAFVTLIIAWFGLCATAGSIAAARLVQRVGPPRAALVTLMSMATGLLLLWVGGQSQAIVIAAAAIWGFGTFATMSIQQARLALNAPHLTSASIALNTSAIYIGQAAGASLGGAAISAGHISSLPVAGAAILIGAAATSLFAMRWER
jgi:predicted MFS family arabinose efflux permease